eukprot:g2762.t1
MNPERLPSNTVRENELVILYLSPDNIHALYPKVGEVFNCRFGCFQHSNIIGQEFGTKITNAQGRHIFALSPTPELWSRALAHRTQIIYTMDASVISLMMDLRPGMVCVESGTGSGSLSHHFARCVMPTGHLHTFEFNETRVHAAKSEFSANKIDCVTVRHRDVCAEGFSPVENADAVFLDLPAPWLAVPHAAKILKSEGAICCFSPCIEQVMRTCNALRENGFNRIKKKKDLTKEKTAQEVSFKKPTFVPEDSVNNKKKLVTRPKDVMKGHTSFLTFAKKI